MLLGRKFCFLLCDVWFGVFFLVRYLSMLFLAHLSFDFCVELVIDVLDLAFTCRLLCKFFVVIGKCLWYIFNGFFGILVIFIVLC